MVNSSRGMGLENRLPWPSLKKDYERYISLSTKPSNKGKKNVIIKGRRTWESTSPGEAAAPDVINIVISTTLKEPPQYVQFIARDFLDALEIASSSPVSDKVDMIWVLGGAPVYKEAFESLLCQRIYLTRIHGDFPCDTFLPTFEHKFRRVDDDNSAGKMEENGIQYEFEVFERKSIQLNQAELGRKKSEIELA